MFRLSPLKRSTRSIPLPVDPYSFLVNLRLTQTVYNLCRSQLGHFSTPNIHFSSLPLIIRPSADKILIQIFVFYKLTSLTPPAPAPDQHKFVAKQLLISTAKTLPLFHAKLGLQNPWLSHPAWNFKFSPCINLFNRPALLWHLQSLLVLEYLAT